MYVSYARKENKAMKKRNILIAAALAGIMLVSGCSGEKKPEATTPAESTTTTQTEASAAPADETKADTTTEAADTTTEAEETEPEDVTDEPEESGENESAPAELSDAPFGETVIQEGVEISFTDTINNMKNVLGGDTYTFNMEYNMIYGEQEMKMKMVVAQDPALGTYSDTNMLFVVTRMIKRPDGSLIIIDDANKSYVTTTEEESGTQISTDTSSAFIPVKEDITTADLVQFPDGSKQYYRFFITKENMMTTDSGDNESEAGSDGSDAYIYFDAETLSMTNMYMNTQGTEVKAYIDVSADVDASLFELPADYKEITFEEYQTNLMSSFGSAFNVSEE